jgi:protein subunit release factor A
MEPPYDIPESDDALLADCDVQAFHASGPGGQSVNTSDSAVRIRHRPSGVTVVCRRERSQLQNKRVCIERLRAKLEALNAPPDAPRVATRKSRGVRASELAAKKARGRVKQLRQPPGDNE